MAVVVAVPVVVAWSGVAQFVQNLAAGGLTVPQFGQPAARGFAHCMQNRAPARFAVPHLGQVTSVVAAAMEIGPKHTQSAS